MDEKNPAYYIAIEGVIGVGKTTLARMLRDTYNTDLLLEVFEENPFLSDFYGDRARYAFQTQIFFLLSRYHQQNKVIPGVLAAGKSIFSDYTFDKDSLFAGINIITVVARESEDTTSRYTMVIRRDGAAGEALKTTRGEALGDDLGMDSED